MLPYADNKGRRVTRLRGVPRRHPSLPSATPFPTTVDATSFPQQRLEMHSQQKGVLLLPLRLPSKRLTEAPCVSFYLVIFSVIGCRVTGHPNLEPQKTCVVRDTCVPGRAQPSASCLGHLLRAPSGGHRSWAHGDAPRGGLSTRTP